MNQELASQQVVRPLAGGSAFYTQGQPCSLRWYVAETHPRKEQMAIEHLARQGFVTFFPRFPKHQVRRQRSETVLSAAFPGYVFVAFDIASERWGAINSTRGVKRLVGSTPSKPQPVPVQAMKLLESRCRDDVIVNFLNELAPGDLVEIYKGPLAKRIAKIESLDNSSRISVLFEILGSEKIIKLDRDSVGPVIS